MTRAEILQAAKPILFNTEMVRAILDGRKTQTRRVCQISTADWGVEHSKCDYVEYPARNCLGLCGNFYKGLAYMGAAKPSYQPGDVLWVRETWAYLRNDYVTEYAYRADNNWLVPKWRPSIHMPKEAARIFLRVTDVRVERLKLISDEDVSKEGVLYVSADGKAEDYLQRLCFADVWDSTIKKSDLPLYGWDANPWVWVYEFEQISESEVKDDEHNR